MNAVVKSGEIPYTDVQLEGITAGATSLRSVASAVRDGTADIVTAWSAISGSYEGPSDQELFDVMTPIGPQGTTFGDDLDSAAKALDTFVEEATPIVAALKAYVTRAEQLQRDVAAFQPQTIQTMDGPVTQTESWDQDETLNGENNDIINGVANRVVEYQAAERKCANAIRSLSGLPALHAITGSGDDALGYGYDELPMGTQLPWGTAESRNESCAEKTTWFLPHLVKGVVWDGVIVGTLGGIGELIGFRDWKWSGDNFVDTWKSLGSLIGYDKESNEWWNGDAAKAGWGGLLKGTLAWDKWADDPGTALGESGWNVVSIVIPFFGVASKVGAVGRTGEVASAISKAGKALDLVDAGAWASRGLTKVLPNLGDLKGVLTNGFEHLPDTFRTRIAEFRIDLNEWRHGSHADADSTVDGLRRGARGRRTRRPMRTCRRRRTRAPARTRRGRSRTRRRPSVSRRWSVAATGRAPPCTGAVPRRGRAVAVVTGPVCRRAGPGDRPAAVGTGPMPAARPLGGCLIADTRSIRPSRSARCRTATASRTTPGPAVRRSRTT